jgi:hypothetical protein
MVRNQRASISESSSLLERLIRRGIALRVPVRRPMMDEEPKRQEPDILPPVPQVEPGRSMPEIPPDKGVPEKSVPTQGGG